MNPNMLFKITRSASGRVEFMHFYACLGKIPPVFGKEVFSYLFYARDPHMTSEEIQKAVDVDAAKGVFELDGVVITNATTWSQCGVL